jgi:hypothetical protein
MPTMKKLSEALGKSRSVMYYSIKGEGNAGHVGLSSRGSWGRSRIDS